MYRLHILIISATVLAGSAIAGQIQIGGTNGLTSSYITTNGGTIGGSWSEKNYDTNMFFGATNGGNPMKPYATYSQTSANTGTLTDTTNGVVFNMIDDGTSSGASNNYWVAGAATTTTIPIGIFGATDVWTMLNNSWGASNTNETTVTFNFGSTATNANGPQLVINLTDALANSSTPSGQVRAAVDCTVQGSSTCNNFANGPLAPSTPINGITVKTGNVFTSAYNGGVGGVYASSTGNINLDDQGFLFGTTYASYYLVNVQITEKNGGASVSRTDLSAISVDTVPEPVSFSLVGCGILLLGARFLRRSRSHHGTARA